MEETTKNTVDMLVPTFFSDPQPKADVVDGMYFRIDVDPTWIKDAVQNVLDKRIARNPKLTMVSAKIEKAQLHDDENMTIVVVDCQGQQVVGWSKFNPKDIRFLSGISKKGNVWYRKETKFEDMAGIMKAIHRAVDKLLEYV